MSNKFHFVEDFGSKDLKFLHSILNEVDNIEDLGLLNANIERIIETRKEEAVKFTFPELIDYLRDVLCEVDGDFVAEMAEKITGHSVKYIENENGEDEFVLIKWWEE